MYKIVEIIRYGKPDLGVQVFGVFDLPIEDILSIMREYNVFRGGKYPAIYVQEFPKINPTDLCISDRYRYDLDQ
jgi:hypothetical protein